MGRIFLNHSRATLELRATTTKRCTRTFPFQLKWEKTMKDLSILLVKLEAEAPNS